MTDFWTQIPSDLLGQDTLAQKADDWAQQQRAKLADMWAQSQKNVLDNVKNLWQNDVSGVTAPAALAGGAQAAMLGGAPSTGPARITPTPAFQPPLQQYENTPGIGGLASKAVDTGLGALNWGQQNIADPFLGTAYGGEMEAKQALTGQPDPFVQNLPQDTLQNPLAQAHELGARWAARQDISELPPEQQTSSQIMHSAADAFNPVYWAMGGPLAKSAEGGIEALPTALNLGMAGGQIASETPRLPGESQGVYDARTALGTAGQFLPVGHAVGEAALGMAKALPGIASAAGKGLEALGEAGTRLGVVPGLSIKATPEIWELRDAQGNLRATAESQAEARHIVARNPSLTATRSVQPDESPAGYTRFFHGSGSKYDVPNPARFDKNGLFGPGYYMTDNAKVAFGYPGNGQTAADVRSINVPKDLNLIDADAPVNPGLVTELYRELGPKFGRAYDQLQNIKKTTGRFFGSAEPTNYEIYKIAAQTTNDDLTKVNDILSKAGYDGIQYAGGKRIPMMDEQGKPITHTALAIFPNAMPKLRNALSGAQMGGVAVGATGMLPQMPGESNDQYQRNRTIARTVGGAALAGSLLSRDPGLVGEGKPFYSLLEHLVDGKIGGRATGAQIKKTLEAAGAKPAEMAWTGLDKFLDSNLARVIPKQELQDFVRQNAVQVQEVIRGAPAPGADESALSPIAAQAKQKLDAIDKEFSSYQTSLSDKYHSVNWSTIWGKATSEEQQKLADYDTKRLDIFNKFMDAKERYPANPSAKFQTYSTPGGENYRELLLTLPQNNVLSPEESARFQQLKEKHLDNSAPPLSDAERQELNKLYSKSPESGGQGFRSQHWDEPNVLAHIRFDERTAPDGTKTLFVQEIQSDWAQAARKQQKTLVKSLADKYGLNAKAKDVEAQVRRVASPEETKQLNTKGFGDAVPNSPFGNTEDWTKLAMKRVVSWAAQHGFDRVAWTPGDIQNERYHLGTSLDRLEWRKVGNDNYHVVGVAKGGDGEVFNMTLPESDLADHVSEEVANKITDSNATSGVLRGDDLSVGGNGMRAYYDKIVPNVAKDLIKKHGGQVGQSDIPTKSGDMVINEAGRDTWEVLDPLGNTLAGNLPSYDAAVNAIRSGKLASPPESFTTVHSFDLTPALKQSAINGQSLFAVAPAVGAVAPNMPGETQEQGDTRRKISAAALPLAFAGATRFRDPELQSFADTLREGPTSSKFLQSGTFIERAIANAGRAWTDSGTDLWKLQKGVEAEAKRLGRPLNMNEMFYEHSQLTPNPAAESMIAHKFAPITQSVGDDVDSLAMYTAWRHNIEVANAIGEKRKAAVLAEPLQNLPAQDQLATLNQRNVMYNRFLQQAQAAHDGTAEMHYQNRIRITQQAITRAQTRLASQTTNATAARASRAALEGVTARQNRKFPGGYNVDSSMQKLQDLENEIGPQRWQKVEAAAQQVVSYGRDLLTEKLDAGIITQDDYDYLTQTYPEYVPMRIMTHMDADPKPGPGLSRTLSLRDTGIRQLSEAGTEDPEMNPLAAMVDATYSAKRAIFRNNTFNAIINGRAISPDMQYIFKEVPNSYEARPDEGVLQGFVQGERKTFVMPKDLARAVENAPASSIPAVNKAMSVFRALVASNNPLFIPKHAMYTIPAYVLSTATREGGPQAIPKVVGALMSAYFDAFGAEGLNPVHGLLTGQVGPKSQAYLEAGGGMFGRAYEGTPNAAQLSLNDTTKQYVWQKGKYGTIDHATNNVIPITNMAHLQKIVKDVLTGKLVGEIINRVDLAPRSAAFDLAVQRTGGNTVKSASEGRTTSIDFRRGGNWARTINQLVPFFNVAVQGTTLPFKLAAENPKSFWPTLITMVGIPTIAAAAWNYGDAQRKADYDDKPDYYKKQGILIMLPGPAPMDAQGNRKPQAVFIPTKGLSPFVSFTQNAIEKAVDPTDTQSWASMGLDALEGFLPMPVDEYGAGLSRMMPLGPIAGTPIQELTNTNIGTGAAVASKAADQRAGTVAQLGAQGINAIGNAAQQAMGNQPNVAVRPSQVQFGINESLGGAGRLASSIGAETNNAGNVPQYQPITGPIASMLTTGSTGQNLTNARENTMTPALRKVLAEGGINTVSPAAQEIKNMQLTQAEETEFQTMMNKELDQWAKTLDAYPAFQRLTPAEKQRVLQTRMSAVRQQVARQYLGELIKRNGTDAIIKRIQQSKAQAAQSINQSVAP